MLKELYRLKSNNTITKHKYLTINYFQCKTVPLSAILYVLIVIGYLILKIMNIILVILFGKKANTKETLYKKYN